MIYSVEPTEIPAILIHQLEGFFPLSNEEKNCIKTVWGGGSCKVEHCFKQNPNKYYLPYWG